MGCRDQHSTLERWKRASPCFACNLGNFGRVNARLKDDYHIPMEAVTFRFQGAGSRESLRALAVPAPGGVGLPRPSGTVPTTRDLIDRIDADPVLRRLCGWPRRSAPARPDALSVPQLLTEPGALRREAATALAWIPPNRGGRRQHPALGLCLLTSASMHDSRQISTRLWKDGREPHPVYSERTGHVAICNLGNLTH